jgi:hypothetical protein
VNAFPEGHEEAGDSSVQATTITGRFRGSIWGIACILELHLDEAGRLRGALDADGELLEVTGDVPDALGGVWGVIRARVLEENFAAFRARADVSGLLLEVRMTEAEERALEHATFTRIPMGDAADPR